VSKAVADLASALGSDLAWALDSEPGLALGSDLDQALESGLGQALASDWGQARESGRARPLEASLAPAAEVDLAQVLESGLARPPEADLAPVAEVLLALARVAGVVLARVVEVGLGLVGVALVLRWAIPEMQKRSDLQPRVLPAVPASACLGFRQALQEGRLRLLAVTPRPWDSLPVIA
jgi:hypothetical protein